MANVGALAKPTGPRGAASGTDAQTGGADESATHQRRRQRHGRDARHDRPGDALPMISVLKQGMLTKLSKGGFTANWNRRAFALLGSSLYYAKEKAGLAIQPKLFAEVTGCQVLSWNDEVTVRSLIRPLVQTAGPGPAPMRTQPALSALLPRVVAASDTSQPFHPPHCSFFCAAQHHDNTLAIRLPADNEYDEPEMLLLAADSAKDKFAWIDAITKGSRMPRCPIERVAPLLSLRMYGGTIDTTMDSVLQAAAETRPQGEHGRRAHGDRKRGAIATIGTESSPPALRQEAIDARNQQGGQHRRHHHSRRTPAPPSSPAAQEQPIWSLDRWVPDFFRNV